MKQNQIEEFFVWDETNLIKPHNNCDDKIKNDDCNSIIKNINKDITDPKLRKKAYDKAYRKANIDKTKANDKAYYAANPDKLKARAKAWCEANPDKRKATDKAYRDANRDKIKAYYAANKDKLKAYYAANPDKAKARAKAWREANPDKKKVKAYNKAYRAANKDKLKAYRVANKDKLKAYRVANRDKINARHSNYIKTNIQYKLSVRLRNRLYQALQGNYKNGSAVRDLGCSIDELKMHLESKFQYGMNWDNWSFEGWHIDHIKPLASFDLTDRKQLLLACHYTNLQPLWAIDNLSKGDRTKSN
jgi:hypothetical protein